MVNLINYKITIENLKGSYKSFETEGDDVWNSYPLKGVTYPVDYGCIEGYEGEDEAELDIFIGTGELCGYITVWRLDVPTETKMFSSLTEEELKSVLDVFGPVLVNHNILNESDFDSKIESFKKVNYMQQEKQLITVSTKITAPIEKVWEAWTQPEFITKWNHASDDWECPSATNDLTAGGEFHYQMSAKDGSVSFDFNGTYTDIITHEKIEYTIEDGRTVVVTFEQVENGQVLVTETFEAETENPIEMQRAGWQAILENFREVMER